jgi:hypothetical protein
VQEEVASFCKVITKIKEQFPEKVCGDYRIWNFVIWVNVYS